MGKQLLKSAIWGSCLSLLTACGSGSGGGDVTPPAQSSTAANSSALAQASSVDDLPSSAVTVSSAVLASSSSSAVLDCNLTNAPTQLQSHASVTMIEAEAFDTCSDPQSVGGVANSQIDVLAADDASAGFYIGEAAAGEYVEYTLAVSFGGIYSVELTGKAAANTLPISVLIDDTEVGRVNLAEGDWAPVKLEGVYLSGGEHRLRVRFDGAGAQLDALTLTSTEDDTLTATDIVQRMGTGINLGNTLDKPKGANWGAQPEEAHFFDDFKSAGFGHVRIPVTWGDWTSEAAPYTIDAAFINRVEKTVDWALERGLYVVLNAHHEKWFKEDYPVDSNQQPTDATPTAEQAATIAENNARLEAIWVQMAERFKTKPKRLVFEILNEPFGMTTAQVDDLNPRLLAIMRETNPSRAVVFSGAGYTPYNDLIAAKVPAGTNLIANFHNYDPWAFAGQCARRWGSDSDKAALRSIYQQVADWAAGHNIPATVNEFSAAIYDWENPENSCNVQDRQEYIREHVELQNEFGIPGTVWDDDGAYRIYDRKNRQWDDVLGSLIF